MDAVSNEAFNVGVDEDNHQVLGLAEIVKEVVPGSRIEFMPGAGPDKRCYRVSFAKLSARLPGFRAQWNARRGAQQLYETFLRLGLTHDDYAGGRFRRVLQVRDLLQAGVLNPDLRRVQLAGSRAEAAATASRN
jgi:hypothetical protein